MCMHACMYMHMHMVTAAVHMHGLLAVHEPGPLHLLSSTQLLELLLPYPPSSLRPSLPACVLQKLELFIGSVFHILFILLYLLTWGVRRPACTLCFYTVVRAPQLSHSITVWLSFGSPTTAVLHSCLDLDSVIWSNFSWKA